MDYREFSKKIRAKYPGAYDDLDDRTLAEKIVQKYPQYSDVTFEDPKSLLRRSAEAVVRSPALPIAGSVAGGIAGAGLASIPMAGLGAAGGESIRQLAARGLGMEAPQSSLEAAKKIGLEGAFGMAGEGAGKLVGMAIKPLSKPAGKLISNVGKKGAEVVEAITGVKPQDTIQAARQGLKTYAAPGMEKAQEIFGKALEKTGIKPRPPLKQILDPQLGVARKIALEVGEKLEANSSITAEEALRARQAVDRIYAATPVLDRATRGHLLELRSAFDTAMSNQSGALKEASDIYRKAIVKSNLLKPLRITKQGQLSAVTPILASTIGSFAGVRNSSPGTGAGVAATTLAATSPLLWGAGITTAADLARIASSRMVGKAILQAAIRRARDKGATQRQGQQ